MILIADSGSTKTDWRLIDDDKNIHPYTTIGLNPYFQTTEQIAEEIRKDIVTRMRTEVVESDLDIFFYGAGCSNISMCKVVDKALKNNFHDANIEVNHDLLAAARALCKNSEGIASIIGTGSNSCYYDGKKIVENIPALGYLLGDEGSGAHIGKTFIIAYLYDELPKSIATDFYDNYKLNKGDIFEHAYRKPLPNKFLASFSKYIHQNIHHPYLSDLVKNCFHQFFEKHICKYSKHKQVPFHCVGSVGFYYADILRSVALEKGIKVGSISEFPIEELVKFHL